MALIPARFAKIHCYTHYLRWKKANNTEKRLKKAIFDLKSKKKDTIPPKNATFRRKMLHSLKKFNIHFKKMNILSAPFWKMLHEMKII